MRDVETSDLINKQSWLCLVSALCLGIFHDFSLFVLSHTGYQSQLLWAWNSFIQNAHPAHLQHTSYPRSLTLAAALTEDRTNNIPVYMTDTNTGSPGSRTPIRSPASTGMISGRSSGAASPIRVEDLQRTMSTFNSRTAERPTDHRTKPRGEKSVRDIEMGTKALMVEFRLPIQWWPKAMESCRQSKNLWPSLDERTRSRPSRMRSRLSEK